MNKPALILAAALMVAGCKKKVETPPPPPIPAPMPKAAEVPQEVVQEMIANFSRVHFELDSSELDEQSKAALVDNAKLMQANPQVTIEVQGHADERGTTDYNVALGDRRAKAVQEHLALLGISGSRVRTVSYGEERPVASGSNESAWSQNRRVEFRILTGPSNVKGTTE